MRYRCISEGMRLLYGFGERYGTSVLPCRFSPRRFAALGAAETGRPARGGGGRQLEETGLALSGVEHPPPRRHRSRTCVPTLGEARFAALHAEGGQMSFEEAVGVRARESADS